MLYNFLEYHIPPATTWLPRLHSATATWPPSAFTLHHRFSRPPQHRSTTPPPAPTYSLPAGARLPFCPHSFLSLLGHPRPHSPHPHLALHMSSPPPLTTTAYIFPTAPRPPPHLYTPPLLCMFFLLLLSSPLPTLAATRLPSTLLE